MIEAHTVDAWTRASSRHTLAFRNATILGGFAAPLFLWLAGVAVVLAAERTFQKTGDRCAAIDGVVKRGLEIFILAFLFRLQAFIVSPGGPAIALFRVDILNVMGPAIAAAGGFWAATHRLGPRVGLFATVAAAIAMLTPIVRGSAAVEALPIWLQWYIRPAGEYTTFTLFPWSGFVFAGGAVGALIASCRDAESERRLQYWIAVVGAAMIAIGAYSASRPSIYRESYFWTSSPAWFAMRVGVLMTVLAAIYAVVSGSLSPIVRLGRSSLFIYWIHVELVYGYASWLWRGRLPLWGTAVAYVPFVAGMYGVLILRDRLLAKPRVPAPAPAYTAPR